MRGLLLRLLNGPQSEVWPNAQDLRPQGALPCKGDILFLSGSGGSKRLRNQPVLCGTFSPECSLRSQPVKVPSLAFYFCVKYFLYWSISKQLNILNIIALV